MMVVRKVWWDGDQMHTQEVPLDEVYLQEKDSMDTMDFGDALAALKAGSRVAREGWNGKGMWVLLVEAYEYNPTNAQAPEIGLLKRPFLMMRTADSQLVPWVASQTDILAEDWVLA